MRTEPFTMQEFQALRRNADGDLMDLLDVWLLLEPSQVELLSEDDWSRYWDYREDMDCQIRMLKEEFGS